MLPSPEIFLAVRRWSVSSKRQFKTSPRSRAVQQLVRAPRLCSISRPSYVFHESWFHRIGEECYSDVENPSRRDPGVDSVRRITGAGAKLQVSRGGSANRVLEAAKLHGRRRRGCFPGTGYIASLNRTLRRHEVIE